MAFGQRCAAIARRASSLSCFARRAAGPGYRTEMRLGKAGVKSSPFGSLYPLVSSHQVARGASYSTSPYGRIGPDGLPVYVDWRKAGAVTEVSDQGPCGACWAYATTATLVAMNFKRTGQLIKLSAQQLIDGCNLTCHGCDGGPKENGGLVPDSDYPYQGYQNYVIKPEKLYHYGVTVDDFFWEEDVDEMVLKRTVAAHPVGSNH